MPSTDYRISAALTTRVVGATLVVLGALVLLVTLLLGVLGLGAGWLLLVVAGGLVVVAVTAWLVGRGGYVVRLTEEGYRVRLVRGAGVRQARWPEVEDAVTSAVAGDPCVVLRLRDGRTTTIPVRLLAADREEFVRDLQQHLQRGHGITRLSDPGATG